MCGEGGSGGEGVEGKKYDRVKHSQRMDQMHLVARLPTSNFYTFNAALTMRNIVSDQKRKSAQYRIGARHRR